MTEKKPNIVAFPSDDEMKVAFEAYALALGKVAYAWNFLHERLARLFVMVVGAPRDISLALWYSPDSDRVKQKMLKDAILAHHKQEWSIRHEAAREDLLWLMDRVMNLGDSRNNAVHAPCMLVTDHDGSEMAASFVSGHERAQKMRGKQILVEFDWIEAWAEELTVFTERLANALQTDKYPWPERPSKPNRRPRNALDQPRPPHTI